MNINQKVEALETLVVQQGKELDTLKESFNKLKNKLLLAQGAHAILSPEEEFEALKLLLDSPSWPSAVESHLICNTTSDQDKQDRAEGILDIIIDVHLEKLHFLDFGCGEGHVVNQSLKQSPKMVVGYDITTYPTWDKWEKNPKCVFTTNWEDVEKNGPYNVVLIYDVIDHMVDEANDPASQLRKLRKVLAPNAKVYVRCHPWVSRHATHLYHQINKAYIHLVFNEEELSKLGYTGQPARRVIHPLSNYNEWFRQAGLNMLRKEKTTTSPTEPFFSQTPLVAKRIKKNWQKSSDPELKDGKKFPWQLDMQFVDYVLGVK